MPINYHYNRRNRNFLNRKVSEALPEHITTDFTKFVDFLETYYQQLDSDGTTSFGNDIKQLFQLRDAGSTPQINNLISDIAAGLPNGDNFTDARYAVRRLAELQRNKGTRFSIEEFFRLFFQDRIVVEYPKDDLFIVGAGDSNVPASLIGPESLKVIQNGKLFQVFSILIKTALSSNTWEALYKKFIHPAGFFFAGEITSDTEANLNLGLMPISIEDSAPGPKIVSEGSTPAVAPFVQLTALIDSDNNGTPDFRMGLDQLVSVYQNLTLQDLEKFYSSTSQLITPNSFTFDDSNIRDSAANATPDFSLATETMDNEIFGNYLIDSTF